MNVINTNLALQKLKGGYPIIFQTDTLPAIGCLPEFSKIIYEIKKRNKDKPLILMGGEKKHLIEYVHHCAKEDFESVASKFWPGALTMIMPVSEKKRSFLTSKDSTLGLRIPNSNMAQSFLQKSGPLLTSSANISGITGSITVEGIAIDFPNVDILGPLPWKRCSGTASTIISWVENQEWRLIREGQIQFKEIC